MPGPLVPTSEELRGLLDHERGADGRLEGDRRRLGALLGEPDLGPPERGAAGGLSVGLEPGGLQVGGAADEVARGALRGEAAPVVGLGVPGLVPEAAEGVDGVRSVEQKFAAREAHDRERRGLLADRPAVPHGVPLGVGSHGFKEVVRES
jgi:hypothetical protein